MATMNYALQQRVIDGTGKILDTTPGTPDTGSYVTEDQLKAWIKEGICNSGYYYNGNFYKESTHVTVIPKTDGALYVDMTNTNKALYTCISSTYYSLTEEAQIQQVITNLQNGTLVPLKAVQDQNGAVIDTTYATKAAYVPKTDIVDNLTTQDATKPLSANQGYVLDGKISDVKNACEARDSALDARVSNLEQKAGDYSLVDYSGYPSGTVPTGKAKYALAKTLRGVTRVWNQLCHTNLSEIKTMNTSGTWSDNVYTYNNITFTVTSSGISVTTTGTVPSDTYFYVSKETITGGSRYMLIGGSISGSASTYFLGWMLAGGDTNGQGIISDGASGSIDVHIRVKAGATATGVLFKPQAFRLASLGLNSVSTTGEAVSKIPALGQYNSYYAGTLDSTRYTEIESWSKNLINLHDYTNPNVTITYEDDGSITVVAPYGTVSIFFTQTGKLSAGTYTILSLTQGHTLYVMFNASDYSHPIFYQQSYTFTYDGISFLRFLYDNQLQGTTVNYKLQVERGSSATSYSPYGKIGSITLSSPVELRSAGSVHEELDVESGKKTRPIGSFNGADMTFVRLTEQGMNLYSITTSPVAKTGTFKITNSFGLDVKANFDSSTETNEVMQVPISGGIIYVLLKTTRTLSDFNVTYELATPLEDEQLTPVIDNTLLTEANGTITPKQENKDSSNNSLPSVDANFTMGYLTV